MTQEQLAVAAEVSASTVYNTEAGKTRPRPAILRRLARALNVEPQAIDLAATSIPVDTWG
jgi:transcriptional regulator with XRE-family HTH domain